MANVWAYLIYIARRSFSRRRFSHVEKNGMLTVDSFFGAPASLLVFTFSGEREMNQHYRTMNNSLIIAMRTDYFTGNHASVMGDGVGRANSSH